MWIAVAVLAAASIWWIVDHRTGRADEFPAGVRRELTTMARDALEGDRQACAVRVLGTDPPAAAHPRTVFVWSRCTTVGGDVPPVSSAPAAVHLTDPPTAEFPGDGARHGPDVRRIFPRRLHDLALGDGTEFGLEPELRRRVQEIVRRDY